MSNEPHTVSVNLYDPESLGPFLQGVIDTQTAAERSLIALTALLAVYMRGLDTGPISQAKPGEVTAAMLSAIDALQTGGFAAPMLDVMKSMLTNPEFTPDPPPKGGTRLRLVGGTEGPEAKAA